MAFATLAFVSAISLFHRFSPFVSGRLRSFVLFATNDLTFVSDPHVAGIAVMRQQSSRALLDIRLELVVIHFAVFALMDVEGPR